MINQALKKKYWNKEKYVSLIANSFSRNPKQYIIMVLRRLRDVMGMLRYSNAKSMT